MEINHEKAPVSGTASPGNRPQSGVIDIVVVNWNSGRQLADMAASVVRYHQGLVRSLVIVDNASTDHSLSFAGEDAVFPFMFKVIRNMDNRGFGAACNQGAALAAGEYLLFLNPDTVLFENSLSIPRAYLAQPVNGAVGIVGIQLVDARKRVARTCARFPSAGLMLSQALGVNRLPGLRHLSQQMCEWAHDTTRQVDQVMGAFLFMRRSLFVSLGGFDERFFVYFEEVDLSLRARQSGWKSVYLSEGQAFHAGCGTSDQIKARRLFYYLRSRLFYWYKHFSGWQPAFLLAVTLGPECLFRLVYSLFSGGAPAAANIGRAYGLLLRDLSAIVGRGRHL